MKCFRTLLGALVLLLAASVQSHAKTTASLQGRYFLVVWGYQGDDDLVKAHSFASFYKGNDLVEGQVRPATISWLPATGKVHVFGTERGRNYSLTQTLEMACRSGREIKSWGPYEIEPELYRRALRRIKLLNSGRVAYSMVSAPGSMNCIDAVGNITGTPLETGILWGFAASSAIVQHLSPYLKNDGRVAEAVSAIAVPAVCSK